MTALVLTAHYGYADPDRLDVTRMRATMPGLALAPSWELLRPYKALARAGQLADVHWDAYRAAYVAEMRASYRRHRDAWRAIAARALADDVTLVCFCGDAARCHRSVAAALLVAAAPRLLDGATLEYAGEAERTPRQRPPSGFVCTRGRGKGCHPFGPPPGPWSRPDEVERTADLVLFPGADGGAS